MFGSSKPVAFKPVPYMRRREPRRVPRWLILLLLGAALGAGGNWYAQENMLPPRLSSADSQRLRADLAASQTELQTLRVERTQVNDKLAQAQAREQKAVADLSGSIKSTEKLQKNLSQMMAALPPDPRGGVVGIRAATFSAAAGQLTYNVLLTQPAKTGETFNGVVQFVVTGTRGGTATSTVTLNPVALELDALAQVTGSVSIPEALVPREIAVRVLRRAGGELVSMRVFRVS